MHLIGEQGVGLLLFIVLTLQGVAMLVCTGRFLQIKPRTSLDFARTIWLVSIGAQECKSYCGWYTKAWIKGLPSHGHGHSGQKPIGYG